MYDYYNYRLLSFQNVRNFFNTIEMEKQKNQKITFRDYYNSLKQKPLDFITQIAKECGVTERTVYNWISGDIIPDKSHQDKITEITGISADSLFKQFEKASA